MAEPSIDPSIFGKAMDWVVTGIGGMVATVWGFLRADIRRTEDGIKQCLTHIEKLYQANELDREKTRDMIDARADTLNNTITLNQREVMSAIAEIKNKCSR